MSRSAMSLTRYTAPDNPQKIANAAEASATAAPSNSRLANNNPAKTSRFFVHWPGRSEMKRLVAREHPGTAAAGVPETVIGEEVIRATARVSGYTWADAEKLRTASDSTSNVSNTVRSFVMASKSVMRFVKLSNFILPPCRLTVV
jgi:hypothetical protein